MHRKLEIWNLHYVRGFFCANVLKCKVSCGTESASESWFDVDSFDVETQKSREEKWQWRENLIKLTACYVTKVDANIKFPAELLQGPIAFSCSV